MALTRNDETDLLLPLYQGITQKPPFGVFLERLRRRTQSIHTSIVISRPHTRSADTEFSFAGLKFNFSMGNAANDDLSKAYSMQRSALRPYRVYDLTEITKQDSSITRGFTQRLIDEGIADLRILRIPLDDEASCFFTVANDKPCTASDSALLSNLAPHVEVALNTLRTFDQTHLQEALNAQAMSRASTGWIVFDSEARILTIADTARQRITQATGHDQRLGDHLHGIEAHAEKQLAEAAAHFAQEPQSKADGALFTFHPLIDAVLLPATSMAIFGYDESDEQALSILPKAAMIAFCRFETKRSPDKHEHLAKLFHLPIREAELAVMLADGHTIAEAAKTMGLTLETARNYSKRLYAHLNLRGQAELVRRVHLSSAALV